MTKKIFLVLMLFVISGCGYHVAGKAGQMPGNIETLTISMSLRIYDIQSGKVVWQDRGVVDTEDFSVNTADVAATRDRETAALQKLSRDTARLVKERMLEGF